jgi:hypothetical protein
MEIIKIDSNLYRVYNITRYELFVRKISHCKFLVYSDENELLVNTTSKKKAIVEFLKRFND